MITEYKRASEYVAEHMLKALKTHKRENLSVKELEIILCDALDNAHPKSEHIGGYVLYIP
jgi:hypothetical protein